MIKAILLAAGQSKRLKGQNKLIKKFKSIPLINHVLGSLLKSKVNKIIIVIGYQKEKIKKIVKKNKKISTTRKENLTKIWNKEKEIKGKEK